MTDEERELLDDLRREEAQEVERHYWNHYYDGVRDYEDEYETEDNE